MKVANRFVLLRGMNVRSSEGIPIKFGENMSFHLRMAGRALARVPWDKQVNRQSLAAVRTAQICGHLTQLLKLKPQIMPFLRSLRVNGISQSGMRTPG
jgi:hypothetical protein